MVTSRTRPLSTSVRSCENEMSCADVRWPGVLEQREKREQQQNDDHPEGEIAQVGVHP